MSTEPAAASRPFAQFPRLERLEAGRATMVVVVVAAALAATCFLLSAGEGVSEAGSIPWKPGSILHPITDAMTLFHQFPTRRGAEVKWLVQLLAPAALLATLGIAFFLRTRLEPEEFPAAVDNGPEGVARGSRLTVSPTTGAQIALLLLSLWALASSLWSPWPQASFGEGVRQVLIAVWAVGIGRTLTRRGVRQSAWWMIVILGLVGAIGVWYHLERNPQERLKFPIGNPIFMAACLVPGILLALAMMLGVMRSEAGARQVPQPGLKSRRSPVLVIVGTLVALAFMLAAFHLTDSRGPQLALIAGLAAGAYYTAPRKYRRWLLIAFAVLAVIAVFWVRSQLDVQERARGATIRLRLHAWQYATQLFLERPDIGKGQASYPLLAQEMSRVDAEQDPLAFPSGLLGHTHNEWLQILAELGAVGLALCVTSLALTAWAAARAIARTTSARQRWCLIGLLAAFIALIVEEATNVGLRMPALPLVFYTILGMLWAGSREEDIAAAVPARPPALLGIAALVVSIAASGLIVSIASRDWRGALADAEIPGLIENHEWDTAISQAHFARGRRLVLESFISADDYLVRASAAAAADTARQLQEMLARSRQPGTDPAQVTAIAHEDVNRFERYFQSCVSGGERLWERIPAYPGIAALVSGAWSMRTTVQLAFAELQQADTRPDPANALQARLWMLREFMHDRQDPVIGLRLLQLSGNEPIQDRLDMIRIPLRSGQPHPQFELALAALMQDPDFGNVMNDLMQKAQLASVATSAQLWPDPYAPETLRLAGYSHRLLAQFEDAAELAGAAARLSTQIARFFPSAVSHALAQQADHLLLAEPLDASAAVEAITQALRLCPPADRELMGNLQQTLALYQCAVGNEEAARETLASLVHRSLTPEGIDRNIGYAMAELARIFMRFPPEHRPALVPHWIARSLTLVPEWPQARLAATRFALEDGREDVAVRQLTDLEQILADPQQFAAILQQTVADFGAGAALREFVTARGLDIDAMVAATQPVTQPGDSALSPETLAAPATTAAP